MASFSDRNYDDVTHLASNFRSNVLRNFQCHMNLSWNLVTDVIKVVVQKSPNIYNISKFWKLNRSKLKFSIQILNSIRIDMDLRNIQAPFIKIRNLKFILCWKIPKLLHKVIDCLIIWNELNLCVFFILRWALERKGLTLGGHDPAPVNNLIYVNKLIRLRNWGKLLKFCIRTILDRF